MKADSCTSQPQDGKLFSTLNCKLNLSPPQSCVRPDSQCLIIRGHLTRRTISFFEWCLSRCKQNTQQWLTSQTPVALFDAATAVLGTFLLPAFIAASLRACSRRSRALSFSSSWRESTFCRKRVNVITYYNKVMTKAVKYDVSVL